ncbi:MAG: hypothetical protein J3R72DRAFT_237715 [Linnemannia gamsii]|nr:MAG: hypothetical protein J3R72DRAFT_237715 [Linnemannia gamsii]
MTLPPPPSGQHPLLDIAELLLAIGRFLTPSSLSIMCRVNKSLHLIFSPLLYDSVTIDLIGNDRSTSPWSLPQSRERSRLPDQASLKANANHIHHLSITFPTKLDYLDGLECPNLVSLHCKGYRGVKLQYGIADKNRAQRLLDRLIRSASSSPLNHLCSIEFDNLWPARKDEIWGTIATLPRVLKELKLVLPSVDREDLVGDMFWRACANTERLILNMFAINIPKGLPKSVVLDRENGELLLLEEEKSCASRSGSGGDGEMGLSDISMSSSSSATSGTGTGTGTGARPFSFSRVRHLAIIGPVTLGLDKLSLIRYCHNIQSLHWTNMNGNFEEALSNHPNIPTIPPSPDAPHEDYIWRNLESLHLAGLGATDENLATVIRWLFRLSSLDVHGTEFGYQAWEALEHHFRTLRVLDLRGCQFGQGEAAVGAGAAFTYTILTQCSLLESFKTPYFLLDSPQVFLPWASSNLTCFAAESVRACDSDFSREKREEARSVVVARVLQLPMFKDMYRRTLFEQLDQLIE